MDIDGTLIDANSPVYVIAEAGVNYNNKLSIAKKMIDFSHKMKINAIKFQTFSADSIQLKSSIKPEYQKKYSKKNYYEIIKKLEPSLDDQIQLFEYCKKKHVTFLSTPYDFQSVDFLNKLGVSAFKISSSDLTNHPFLEYVLKKRKPVILSTGLSTQTDVDQAIRLVKKHKMINKTILLQTTSDYPAKNSDVNLRVLPHFIKRYNMLVGFSDHTVDSTASIGAISLGVCLIEKHFTLSKKLQGPDQKASLNPVQMKNFLNKILLIQESLGTHEKSITKSEQKNLSMRKIIVLKSGTKNSKITKNSLLFLRGNSQGVLPLSSNLKKILGKKLNCNLSKPKQFSWDMLE